MVLNNILRVCVHMFPHQW